MNGDRSSSRRAVLKLLGAACAIFGAGAAAAEAKSSKAAAAYRASPKGGQSCANCSWFEPPSGCGVVKGQVSARGWCNLWG